MVLNERLDTEVVLQGPMAKACKTAMHRVEIEDGFRVLRTTDSSQTFRLYQRLTNALKVPMKHSSLIPQTEVSKIDES